MFIYLVSKVLVYSRAIKEREDMYKLNKRMTKLKATNEKRKRYKNSKKHTILLCLPRKGGQIYGDLRRFDFGWWASHTIYK